MALSGIAGGTAGIVGAIAAALFGLRPALPFWVVSGAVGAAILSAAAYVREPATQPETESEVAASPQKMLGMLKSLPRRWSCSGFHRHAAR